MTARPNTHLAIDAALVGAVVELGDGTADCELTCTEVMRADERGLIHGGFVFGLADYAAMCAVDHPNVVLGAVETRFVAPVAVGDRVVARARRSSIAGRKHRVDVVCSVGETEVLTGTFTCFVLDQHVFDKSPRREGPRVAGEDEQ